jgi:hypothetical protein
VFLQGSVTFGKWVAKVNCDVMGRRSTDRAQSLLEEQHKITDSTTELVSMNDPFKINSLQGIMKSMMQSRRRFKTSLSGLCVATDCPFHSDAPT